MVTLGSASGDVEVAFSPSFHGSSVSHLGDYARCCRIRSTDTNTVLRPGEPRRRRTEKNVVLSHTFCFASSFALHTTAGCLLLVQCLFHVRMIQWLSWDWGACCALWTSRCNLRDPGWGDPGFPQRVDGLFAPFPGALQL